MSISRLEISDFLVFTGEFSADFCSGVNLLIGSNGTGKTTLLKLIYWGCEVTKRIEIDGRGNILFGTSNDSIFYNTLFPYFYNNGASLKQTSEFKHEPAIKIYSNVISNDIPCLDVNIPIDLSSIKAFINLSRSKNKDEFTQWWKMNIKSVFVPATEMLSHSRGFLALNRERPLPFDNTEIDIISKAELTPTRELTPNARKVIDKITQIIGGQVEFDGSDFFIHKPNSKEDKIYFQFEASGYRKLGLLWKLLRNGLLEDGTVLLWDEPENSLNPEHISVLVDILLELSRNGVQIFLATHSGILASYFAANRKRSDKVLFHSLYKDNGQVKVDSSNRFDLLEPNTLTDAEVNLYMKEVETGLGNVENNN
ncbi:MAG: AAA family ATPase [Prevotellaceae bacterium]|jgi:energy-coupling factor transporter ATP-binding protein EcfA2|nr:AAA family ATPase [Prevotellaceae bacterium]